MGAQGCFCTRSVAPKLNPVVWTWKENMIFGDSTPDFERGFWQPSRQAIQEVIYA
ncbi:hypothetical protein SAMN05216325_1172 [Nitrosomonas marina]|uniref:Uncharacterized protein n=1 Tax=Nitrosomonas marina TaxID=917 RepID=A0A1H8GA22_9PROT|nr:hypothetical protein SAMN05216325_1172 [Nitrosomonas marina]